MEIALCYAGHLRDFKKVYNHNYENIYRPLLELGNIDVFIHTWDKLGPKFSWHTYGNGTGGLDKIDVSRTEIINTFKPLLHKIEDYETAKPFLKLNRYTDLKPKHPAFINDDNICSSTSMFYAIHAADLLRKEAEKVLDKPYDIVVRLRPDLFYGKLLVKEMDLNNYIYVPHYICHPGNQAWPNYLASDQFAIGNNQNMSCYSNCFLDLKRLYKEAKEFWSADEILSNYLRDNNIQIKAIADKWCWK